MKSVLAVSVIACFAGAAFAQNSPPTAPPSPPPATTPPAPAPNPESVEKANHVLEQVAKAYRDATALTDTVTMSAKTPQGAQTQKLEVTLGEGSDAVIAVPGVTFTAVDNKLYVVRDDVADKYFAVALQGTLPETVQNVFGDVSFVPPHIAMRSEQSNNELASSATMAFLDNAKVVGHQMGKTDEGKEAHEVLLQSDNGSGTVFVDSTSNFIDKINLKFRPPGAPAEFELNLDLDMKPVVHENLPTPIAFVPGDRKEVTELEELQPTAIAEGDVAPDFTLPTLTGETVKLSDLKGSVVVLDFWATWCGPCRRGLPKIDELAKWAQSSGQPIKVYGVDVWERSPNPEENKAKVAEYWNSQKFSFPTLLDLDNKAVAKYGFNSIPQTVIVAPNGKIYKIHGGFDPTNPNVVEDLKKEVEAALKVSG